MFRLPGLGTDEPLPGTGEEPAVGPSEPDGGGGEAQSRLSGEGKAPLRVAGAAGSRRPPSRLGRGREALALRLVGSNLPGNGVWGERWGVGGS